MTGDAKQLMDRIYRRQRHIYDATRKFYLLGRDDLIAGLAMKPGEVALEIGCGTGRNLIKIARTYPAIACRGLDVSEEMLASARRAVERAGLQDRIVLAQADATQFDPQAIFGRSHFDRVVISYALSMIPAWERVLRAAADLVAPRGSLHVVDFGDQAGLPRPFKTLLDRWLMLFHVAPRLTLARDVIALAESLRYRVELHSRYRGYALLARVERAI